jgi:PAS domain S-box-containing protein
VIDIIAAQLGLIRTLRGLTPLFGCFTDERFDELRVERRLTSDPMLARAECTYWIRKLQARFFAGDYVSAVEASWAVQRLLWTLPFNFEIAEAHFYGALSHAAACDAAVPAQYPQHVQALTAHHRQLVEWAEHCPENFANRAALVGAEIARIEGRELDAERLYEQAIRSAREQGFVQNEGLAYELAARFYAAHGFEEFARLYLRNARDCYLRWGADGKVRHLDALYPHLRQEAPAPDARGTIGAPIEHLDLATVLNVSQAVSGELVLDKLVEMLLRTAIEHAGAERGLLVLPRSGDLWIQAEAHTSGSAVVVRLRETPVSAAALPESVVRYAARTHESVLLDDATARHPFAADAYLQQQHARSVLCLPLVRQGALTGLLYLENTLTAHAFPPERIAVLAVLAAQAAIALENTRLYRELQEREARIRRLVDANIIGITLWDLQSRTLEANDAFLALVGYSREELASGRMPWTELTPDEWRGVDEQRFAELRATGRSAPVEKEYVRKDGRRVPVLVGSATFEGQQDAGVSFVLDLTERKRAEEALRQAQAELTHVARLTTLGELTASIAHEINQPLGAMVNSAHACLRWLAAQNLERARQSAVRIVADGQRAADTITRIRALAQNVPAQKDWLDLNATLRDVLALVRSEVHRHRVVVETHLAADLPRIRGDRIQLQQVLLNLLMNAIEAMSSVSDGPRVLVVRSDPDASPGVLVAVGDSGPGLEPQQLDRLFEAFYTTKPQGLGLGLAISRRIIEAHGGRLWATANVPRGAVLQFTVPRGSEEEG